MNLAIRCPRCGGNLGTTPAAFPFSFSKKRRFNYCLYCGVSVDEPVEAR
jgi:DNA-directed RNA polymerase subunit RPC12/RpoP